MRDEIRELQNQIILSRFSTPNYVEMKKDIATEKKRIIEEQVRDLKKTLGWET